MNGFLFITFGLFYMLYKYLFLWVMEQPTSSDTGGLFFPMALNHIFVGLYVEQVCLAALLFLARNNSSKPSAVAEGAFMVFLTRGGHEQNFVHQLNFGHNVTIEVHCITFERNPNIIG
jgi:hypothetical protein